MKISLREHFFKLFLSIKVIPKIYATIQVTPNIQNNEPQKDYQAQFEGLINRVRNSVWNFVFVPLIIGIRQQPEEKVLKELYEKTLNHCIKCCQKSSYAEAEYTIQQCLQQTELANHEFFSMRLYLALAALATQTKQYITSQRILIYTIQRQIYNDPLLTTLTSQEYVLECLSILAKNYEKLKAFGKAEELHQFLLKFISFRTTDKSEYSQAFDKYTQILFDYAEFLIRQKRLTEAASQLEIINSLCDRSNKELSWRMVDVLWALGVVNELQDNKWKEIDYKKRAMKIGFKLNINENPSFIYKCVQFAKELNKINMFYESKYLIKQVLEKIEKKGKKNIDKQIKSIC